MFGIGLMTRSRIAKSWPHHDATASARAALGITGHPNRSGNDGTITRFGWKAQNKSITMFAGEAYNVEMGITNELFPTATEEDPDCNGAGKPAPNDVTRTQADDARNQAFDNPLTHAGGLDAVPDHDALHGCTATRSLPTPSAQRGRELFSSIGCDLCHTPRMQTAPAMLNPVLENRPVNLFSDLLVHHMGAGLADDIIQGAAGPDEFRTTPLWGVGQRLFFLHDGRTSDLLVAIKAHFSRARGEYPASEANAVVKNFLKFRRTDQQAILDFLRSL